MWRDSGSSVSSQWMSTSSPRFSAISQSAFRLVGAVLHRALEMRDAADDVDALVERPLEILARPSASENSRPAGRRRAAGRYRARSSSSPPAARRRRSAGRRRCRHGCGWRAVPSTRRGRNSGAPAPSPPRRSEAASARPRARCLRAACRRLVHPRQAERQRRVHVEVAVDEGRRDEPAGGVDDAAGFGGDVRLDRGDLSAGAGDVDAGAAVGEGGVAG